MMNMMMSILILMLMTMSLMMISMLLMKKNMSMEKNSPIECGFNPISFNQIPFSLQFFLIAIIFMIFDVEITLILPYPMMILWSPQFMSMFMSIFIIILMLGTLYEWHNGALNWAM
uniref:NADH dehydrogenase subunit 3 n=1 Tax=Pentapycnon charcoti TaxID=373304 RepID=UPI00226D1DBA|nr:NADH dehydrogenase subunit 3 [Pentapycnon charcoti]UZA61215.1 NADH dehydrogenase subunit 3 [Pentapycnon charcoti]